MGNPRSASNAWAKIKVKLMADGTSPAPTPKKAGGRKKAAAAKDMDGEEGPATPKKPTPRKRAPKKQDVDGESSPKKKTTRGKKASDDEGEYIFIWHHNQC
jgi:hypothetical protein